MNKIKEFLDEEFKDIEYYVLNDEYLMSLRDSFAEKLGIDEDPEKYERLFTTITEKELELAKEVAKKLREIYDKIKEIFK